MGYTKRVKTWRSDTPRGMAGSTEVVLPHDPEPDSRAERRIGDPGAITTVSSLIPDLTPSRKQLASAYNAALAEFDRALAHWRKVIPGAPAHPRTPADGCTWTPADLKLADARLTRARESLRLARARAGVLLSF